jgi:DNA end-binding protein Ku
MRFKARREHCAGAGVVIRYPRRRPPVPTIWKGSITFGLVNVPVELQPAVRSTHLTFRMLHGRDNTPIRYQRVREDDGTVVPWDEIVRGYEIEKGEFVVLSKEDFEEAAVKQSHTLDILDFARAGEVDPRHYESAYFVVPGKGGERAYALLRDAMAETETSGIGKIIVHRRQHIAEIRPDGDALVLMMMRFPEELIPASEYAFPAISEESSRELTMATQLVKTMQGSFDPTKYTDEYDANLQRIIEAKGRGRRVRLEGPQRPGREPRVLDLMERLQASLEDKRSTTGKRAAKHATSRSQRASEHPTRRSRRARKRQSA